MAAGVIVGGTYVLPTDHAVARIGNFVQQQRFRPPCEQHVRHVHQLGCMLEQQHGVGSLPVVLRHQRQCPAVLRELGAPVQDGAAPFDVVRKVVVKDAFRRWVKPPLQVRRQPRDEDVLKAVAAGAAVRHGRHPVAWEVRVSPRNPLFCDCAWLACAWLCAGLCAGLLRGGGGSGGVIRLLFLIFVDI